MKHLVIGMLAHVDAGKTTLSEAMLYLSGSIRKIGRVDNRDTFLDTYEMERARGITIFAKQAEMSLSEWKVTLLDTPGHVDFSAETERTLQVLDYAILIISAADGVQGHTRTLWNLLRKYHIPTFIFVNKMDQEGTDKAGILANIKDRLCENCIDFADCKSEEFYESVAVCDEECLETFLQKGIIDDWKIKELIAERKLFPVFFGAALRLTGVEEFMDNISRLLKEPQEPDTKKVSNGTGIIGDTEDKFGARVFKITRDGQGTRLTHVKITKGSIKVKDVLPESTEKINQIRIYSGAGYETVSEAQAGMVCALTGPENTKPGQGIGTEKGVTIPVLEPVLHYRLSLPKDVDAAAILPRLRQLEEEIPELNISWKEELKEIQAQVMGEVQMEILQNLIHERLGVEITFEEGNIVYRETIAGAVEGVGHFEPLRHYAEVHLLLEPLEAGSGMQFETDLSEDELDRNWQRLVLTHLREKEHKGVLTGSALTDIRVTLVAGRAHPKHTEGGDFRQATYRAIRQGLMQAESILLEPEYEFSLEIPDGVTGRAVSDLNRKNAEFVIEQAGEGMTVITGTIPAACVNNYQKEVHAYSKGIGQFSYTFKGYVPCHNAEEVIERIAYDAKTDKENTADSVFCSHGAGFLVPWDEVPSYMHLPFTSKAGAVMWGDEETNMPYNTASVMSGMNKGGKTQELCIGTDEIDAILDRTFNANKRSEAASGYRYMSKRRKTYGTDSSPNGPSTTTYRPKSPKDEYLLVDGYNIIFAWEELKELAAVNIDGARGRLQDILCNYQAIRGCNLIVVFDAYRVQGHDTEVSDYHNIHVVFTKEAETADRYIEKFAYENGKKYRVTVATSDGLEQIIIRGAGCGLISARELEEEVKRANRQVREEYAHSGNKGSACFFDQITPEVIEQIQSCVKEKQ